MAVVASAVVAVGTVTGVVSTTSGERERTTAAPEITKTPDMPPLPGMPTPSPTTASPSASAAASASATATKKPAATKTPPPAAKKPPARQQSAPVSANLYLHPQSQVLDWVRANRGDPRHALIQARIAAQPAAVWFAEYKPSTITNEVRKVTAGAAAAGRVPVVVPYAIPERDCGGASQGGAPDFGSYDSWIRSFAAGLGKGDVIVILEPDAIAQTDCLNDAQRATRFAALSRAGKALRAANPNARVYFDAGHSGWHAPAKMAGYLRQAGAATNSDGIFTNVSNFHRTADEVAYARQVLSALGGPSSLGAVIDTSRNGNGAPAAGQWCDPAGRALGRPPTTRTGESRIDAYLWVKLPGESDGCKGAAGSFTPDYAVDLANG
ncbi:glycoside hydrolase family 6 protein [Streptomyces sp. CA-294286]|uniref:glycoside hydrolase family 6 protein n=1 Tax=Streptomyces sp. CA-294286 TaxID=3240070 RepID=UPI003D8B9498